MLEPRQHNLPMLGLGYSVGTGPSGIKAEVIVVRSFDELESRAAEVILYFTSVVCSIIMCFPSKITCKSKICLTRRI